MIIVSYNPDLTRFVFESASWKLLDINLFIEEGMIVEEIQPASPSDSSIGYLSDGITAYITIGSLLQAERVCQSIEQHTQVIRQVLVGDAVTLFKNVSSYLSIND